MTACPHCAQYSTLYSRQRSVARVNDHLYSPKMEWEQNQFDSVRTKATCINATKSCLKLNHLYWFWTFPVYLSLKTFITAHHCFIANNPRSDVQRVSYSVCSPAQFCCVGIRMGIWTQYLQDVQVSLETILSKQYVQHHWMLQCGKT